MQNSLQYIGLWLNCANFFFFFYGWGNTSLTTFKGSMTKKV